ncbi:MAG: ribokinase [Herpetosiphonaceae bacterium]|nr:MAG: ribokinase [Herpetosiphonaceae bacterium]
MGSRLAEQVALLAGRRIVVAGDIVLDEYLYGRAERLSREAAIPVLEFRRRQLILGGAANPAQNIVTLGSTAVLAGLVGQDRTADELLELIEKTGIERSCIIVDTHRPTTLKTRVLAEVPLIFAQQLARLDRLDRRPIEGALETRALELLEREIPQADAVLCSDYRTGFLSDRLVAKIGMLCKRCEVPLVVDSQGRLDVYRGADIIRCNADEAASYLGIPLHDEESFRQGLAEMLRRLDAEVIIITRGSEGFSLQGRSQPYVHVPALPIGEVFDATGAGDTFIAVVALGIAAGLQPLDAARIANVAAGLVVRHIGNAVVRADELRRALDSLEEDDDRTS